MENKNISTSDFMKLGNKHLQNTPYSLYQTEKYHLLRIHKNTHHMFVFSIFLLIFKNSFYAFFSPKKNKMFSQTYQETTKILR